MCRGLQCDRRWDDCATSRKKKATRVERARNLHTFTTTRLDDEDILATYAFLDLDSGLAALELVKQHLGLGYAEVVADGPGGQSAKVLSAPRRGRCVYVLCELRVGGSAKNHDVPHLERWWTRRAKGWVSAAGRSWEEMERQRSFRVGKRLIDKGKRFGLDVRRGWRRVESGYLRTRAA